MATGQGAAAAQVAADSDVQAEVMAFLASGRAFGVGPGSVSLRLTHCAAVFLVGRPGVEAETGDALRRG